jgi:hypothetical protein
VKTICNPEGRAEAEFAKAQEAVRKDIVTIWLLRMRST